MGNGFGNLIQHFGIPKILIPNKTITLYLGEPSTGNHIRRQVKYGETEFLAIRSRTETWISNEEKLIEHLNKQNLEIIETVYFTKSEDGGGRYTTTDWKESKVAMTTNKDVDSVSREDLLKAIAEKRVLWVGGWRSMGDGYVSFQICRADNLPGFSGYYFLFDPPCRLTEKMLFGIGDGYEWETEFFYTYMGYFSRFFLSDK